MAQIMIFKKAICIKYKDLIRIYALTTPGSMRALQTTWQRQNIVTKQRAKLEWQLFLAAPIAIKLRQQVPQCLLAYLYLQIYRKTNMAINKAWFWRLCILLRGVNIQQWRVY